MADTWLAYESVTTLEVFDFYAHGLLFNRPFVAYQRITDIHRHLLNEFDFEARTSFFYAFEVETNCGGVCYFLQPFPAPNVIVTDWYTVNSMWDVFPMSVFILNQVVVLKGWADGTGGAQFEALTDPATAWRTGLAVYLGHGYLDENHLRNASGPAYLQSDVSSKNRLLTPHTRSAPMSSGAVGYLLWKFARNFGAVQNGESEMIGYEAIAEFLREEFQPEVSDISIFDFFDSWACARPQDLEHIRDVLWEYEMEYPAPLCQ